MSFLRGWSLLAVGFLSLTLFTGATSACPFCTALEPTLATRRDSAAAVLLAEVTESTDKQTELVVRRALKTFDAAPGDGDKLTIAPDAKFSAGSLAILFGSGDPKGKPEDLTWSTINVDETNIGYFARAPKVSLPTAERLKYFAPYLEHGNPQIAEDAYLEFGHAPFNEVAKAAGILPMAKIRAWLVAEGVSQRHKGFYGLALGLAHSAEDRKANAATLKEVILTPDDDFRAGFDGVLGGYLLLTGGDGLKLIEERYLGNPTAAVGDVRHAMTALRFYHEFGHDIPREKLRAALAKTLTRPEFAEAAIIDLARWEDWESLERIAGLYNDPAYREKAIRRSIIGYLTACPKPAAADQLKKLRDTDPEGVAAAEAVLSRLGDSK